MRESPHLESKSAGLESQDEGLLARLVQASPAVLYACKVTGDCSTIAVTENAQNVLGYAPADFTSDPSFWAVRIHREDSTRVFEEMTRLFGDGEQVIEYRFRHGDGRYVWVRDEMKLEYDVEGRPARIIGCWLDISTYRSSNTFTATVAGDDSGTTTETIDGGFYANQM